MAQSGSPESFRMSCPKCGRSIRIPAAMLGRSAKCPGCSAPIKIPSGPKGASPPAAEHKIPPPPAKPAPPPVRSTIVEPSEVVEKTTNVNVPAGHPVGVQVNVESNKATNSLGIASLVVGVLSLFVCWIPLVGFSLGGLGLVLGVCGIVVSLKRKGTGIGYSIAGAAVSTVGILLGVVFDVALLGMAEGLNEVAKQMERDADFPAKQASPAGSDQTPGSDAAPGGQQAGEQLKAAGPQALEYHDAAKPLQLGAVQIEIVSVHVGKVPLSQAFLGDDAESVDAQLTVWLKISNTTTNKKIDYLGWMSDSASFLDIDAELTDDADNRYRGVSFGGMTAVKGADTSGSIYPGKSISDAVVFEPPIDGAKYLDLKLSAKGCREEGEFRFRIPAEMIQF